SFDGQVWRLGAPAWAGALAAGDGAEVVLGCDGRALARFAFDEALRPDAAAAVRALEADGVAVRLLSGDSPARVQRIAAALGVDGAAGGLTPADKLAAVRAAQA